MPGGNSSANQQPPTGVAVVAESMVGTCWSATGANSIEHACHQLALRALCIADQDEIIPSTTSQDAARHPLFCVLSYSADQHRWLEHASTTEYTETILCWVRELGKNNRTVEHVHSGIRQQLRKGQATRPSSRQSAYSQMYMYPCSLATRVLSCTAPCHTVTGCPACQLRCLTG